MPIEIRELVIKTEIQSVTRSATASHQKQDLSQLKNELLETCKRMISESHKKEKYKR
ncbi:DUF5908 family protein [Kordia sp.]|uniref:DUF5908 family protein n=1 Tax=Kordia sp. TaxID=1965332 RepID=UPI003D2D0A0A